MQIRKGRTAGWLAALVLGLQTLLGRAVLVAQDIQVDINPQRGHATPWYGMWWVWLLAAVFIIVIVALTTRGSGRSTA
jgi:hypothetical protein